MRPATSEFANETTYATLKRWRCMREGERCLRVGFLPYNRFPRHGSWPDLAPTADIHHMTLGCVQEKAPCAAAGVRPFRGNRQRLDQYEESDFADMVATLRSVGLWLVDATPEYVAPSDLIRR